MKIAATAGGGLLLGFHWGSSEASTIQLVGAVADDINFNSYLSISPEGVITIFSPNPELGQNIKTSFPMIVAEELDADWSKVKVVQAVLDLKNMNVRLPAAAVQCPIRGSDCEKLARLLGKC